MSLRAGITFRLGAFMCEITRDYKFLEPPSGSRYITSIISCISVVYPTLFDPKNTDSLG